MEYLDVVNEENEFLGKIEDRNSIHEKVINCFACCINVSLHLRL